MDDHALPLLDSAARLGAYRWIEERLFALTGEWSVAAPNPEIQIYLAELSLQHGWHAELWWDRLPKLDSVDRASLVRPPGAAVETGFERFAAGPEEGGTHTTDLWTWRLAGLVRVFLPRLLVTYRFHRARAVPVTDGPAIRALRLASRDLREAWEAGESLVEGLIDGDNGLQAAASAVRDLEAVFAQNGGNPGLVSWPESA